MNRPRRIATLVHRWTGLFLAGFLTVVGLTGALLAWNDELERVFAPALFTLPTTAVPRAPLDIFTLRAVAERASGGAVNGVDWTREPDAPALFYVEARPGGPPPANDQIAIDPFTGRVLGARRYGDLSQGSINLMPFVYQLHDSLALGETGSTILGIVALLWTIDCFVGAYLTFPARARTRRAATSWLRRWMPSWLLRWRAGGFRLLYDVHRAGGLWPWALMLVIAWSSVSFNLPQVYVPVTRVLLGIGVTPSPHTADPARPPRLDWMAAHDRAVVLMADAARRKDFTVLSERLLFYDSASHRYDYRVLGSLDPGRTGNTRILMDGDTGALVDLSLPTGQVAGETVTSWIGDIHVADVFGIAMKLALTVTGLGIASLSITGVWIWWRKRTAHRRKPRHRTALP